MLARMLLLLITILLIWAVAMRYIQQSNIQHPYTLKNNTIGLIFELDKNKNSLQNLNNILQQANIETTFFVSSVEAKKYPTLIKKIYTNGNGVGCKAAPTHMSTKDIKEQAQLCKKEIENIIGLEPICFFDNHDNLKQDEKKYIESLGMVIINNDIDTRNWDLSNNAVIYNVSSLIQPQSKVTMTTNNQTQSIILDLTKHIHQMGLGFSRICYP